MWNSGHGATWSLASGGASEAAELPLGAASACRLTQCEVSGLRRTVRPTVGVVWFSSLLWLFLWLLCEVLLWLWLFVAACLRQIVVVSFVLLVAMAVLPWLLLASAAVAAAVCGILCILDSG